MSVCSVRAKTIGFPPFEHNRRRAHASITTMAPPPFKSLEELLGSPDVGAEDKSRAYKCWNRRKMVSFMVQGAAPEPLTSGDDVTVIGLGHNRSLNECTGVLGGFEDGRWSIPSLNARVKPTNLVKQQWLFAGEYNTTVVYRNATFTVQVNDDKSIRFLQHNGVAAGVREVRVLSTSMWEEGYNAEHPELSDLSA